MGGGGVNFLTRRYRIYLNKEGNDGGKLAMLLTMMSSVLTMMVVGWIIGLSNNQVDPRKVNNRYMKVDPSKGRCFCLDQWTTPLSWSSSTDHLGEILNWSFEFIPPQWVIWVASLRSLILSDSFSALAVNANHLTIFTCRRNDSVTMIISSYDHMIFGA